MSLLPPEASFEELVQDCFAAFRGAGLMLSALDMELVARWRESGVPYEVVARGIRKAAEKAVWDARPGEPALRSLRACKRAVEVEIEKHRARSVGQGEKPEDTHAHKRSLVEERHARMKSALRKVGREQPLMTRTVEALLAELLAEPPADLIEASAREERVVAALLRGLPFEARLAVMKEARQQAGETTPLSGRARKLSRRFHNSTVLRKAFSLPTFW